MRKTRVSNGFLLIMIIDSNTYNLCKSEQLIKHSIETHNIIKI